MASVLSAVAVEQLNHFPPEEIIKRMRSNMLIHSYLYYWCDDPLWTDDTWQRVADDLEALQAIHPDPVGFYDEAFQDWTGATGAHLPKDSWVVAQAVYVARLAKMERQVVGRCE